jgi:hypothetical protein
MIECPTCRSPVISPENTKFCAVCNHPFLNEEGPLRITGIIPWENFEESGFARALVSTLRKCLLNPRDFFDELSFSHETFRALLYAFILGSIGSVFSFVWTCILIGAVIDFLPLMDDFRAKSAVSAAALIFTPLIVAIKVFFAALYFHGLLYLTRGNKQNIAATIRIVCYTQSTAIFDLIPVFGGIISSLWSLYLLTVGFNKVHKISMFKALMIILLPLVLLIAIIIILALLFGAGLLMHDVFKDSLSYFR